MIQKFALAFGLVGALTLGAGVRAEEDDGAGKGKGKGAAPTAGGKVIQIDVSKLPPDLAKALMKYAAGGDKKAAASEAPSKGRNPAAAAKKPAPKAPMAKGKGGHGGQLPPGLAGKPKDHPGRTHYIQHVLGGKGPPGKDTPAKKAPAKPGKGKPGKGSQDEEE